jgi:DNA polymerase
MQLQNIPRPTPDLAGVDVDALAAAVLDGRDATPGEVDVLIRACIVARPGHELLVLDYASIEARGLAWLAHDAEALAVFASGRDPYRAVAARMFGCAYDAITKEQRQLGKVVELACGYGMGARKFTAQTGADPALVGAWRAARPAVTGLWHDAEDAWALGKRLGPLRFERIGAGMRMHLPSGRWLRYRDVPSRARSFLPGAPIENALEYRGTRFPIEHTYGGKLVENAVQALCRDLLADALVRAERAGLRPVLHVHDEIVCEVPSGTPLEELAAIMNDPPDWAEGLPVATDGFVSRRYRK